MAAALKKADFTSLRGDFKFNINGYPIQNFYLTKVAKRADGKFQTEIVEKVFSNYGDRYAKDCSRANNANQVEGNTMTKTEIAGITRANEGMQGISWNILGQTYVPKTRHRAFLLMACDLPARHFRAAAYSSRSGRVSLHPGRQARLLPRWRRDAGIAGRSGAAADGQAARHLQQVRPHREDAVLGLADPPALRSVLGHSQHEGTDARTSWWRSPPSTTSTSCRRLRGREGRSSSRRRRRGRSP